MLFLDKLNKGLGYSQHYRAQNKINVSTNKKVILFKARIKVGIIQFKGLDNSL